jgi:tRNA U34 2-thiouridine synthase MnmA/TrmU
MDPSLRALCIEVLGGDVDSERFAWLLIEAGINVDGLEWKIASRLKSEREEVSHLTKKFYQTLQ